MAAQGPHEKIMKCKGARGRTAASQHHAAAQRGALVAAEGQRTASIDCVDGLPRRTTSEDYLRGRYSCVALPRGSRVMTMSFDSGNQIFGF